MLPLFFIGSISIANQDWLPMVIGGFAIALVVTFLTYKKLDQLGPVKRILGAVLKMAGFLLLALCLLELEWVKETPQKGSNLVAVIADNSHSLLLKEKAGVRGAKLKTQLTAAEVKGSDSFLNELESNFRVRKFAIDRRLHSLTSFNELSFDGRSSQLNGGLTELDRRFDGQPLAAVIVFTDGNYTDEMKNLEQAAELPPVFFIKAGSAMPAKDLAIGNVTVSESSFEDAPVTIVAKINARGYANQDLKVRLIRDSDGETIATEAVSFDSNVDSKSVRFSFRPTEMGVSFYELKIESSGSSDEATLANNQRILSVNQNMGPHRILYLSGRPNWEFKYFRRALRQDQSLRLSALQRIAKREPRFVWRGRSGEDSNPLFRGFGREDETEEYDQPVLIRLFVESEEELINGFPIEAEELYHYKSIVIDDMEAEFFSPDQQELLESFVSKRGGGLLFLGGAESFAEGGYSDSLFQAFMPVHVGSGSNGLVEEDRKVRIDLTREGMLEFWLRLRSQESTERQRIRNMPNFQSVNEVRSPKPGASLFATVKNEETGEVLPAISVHRYGGGKVAAMTVGDIWRWGFLEPGQQIDRDKMWRQLMRHLTVDVPERMDIEIKSGGKSGEQNIRVRLRDEKFDPQFNAKVKLMVTDPTGESYEFPANPQDSDPGVYRGTFLPNDDGGFRVRVSVAPLPDSDLVWEPKESGWAMNSQASEFASLGINTSWMEKIASASGGRVVEMSEIDSVTETIKKSDVPEMEIETAPIWHSPWFFILALVCFVGEWALRRNNGYA